MRKIRLPKSDLPEQIADAIRQAWPEGVIEMPVNIDEAPFWDVYPKLKAGLSRIQGSAVFYEHEPQGGPHWGEGSDPEEDPPEWNEEPRSYYLFFISLLDDRFRFETDTIEPDEDGVEQRFQGEGRIGCVVGVSLVAPFAVVTLDEMEVFENGSQSDPDVEPHIFSLDGRKLDMEERYREMVDDEGLAVLRKLQAEIVRILNDFEIAVISEEDLDKPVAWLRADDEVLVGHAGEPITVRRAFFFHGL
ncbi:MAG: hypothetical protein HY235_18960 [Acidobacteria bacterium]|nr:hypothetical protein [Acidobacteriota bacterium]